MNEDEKVKQETHTRLIWWVMRAVEMVTCAHIIAGVWRHW
jgi:hypothetical protein